MTVFERPSYMERKLKTMQWVGNQKISESCDNCGQHWNGYWIVTLYDGGVIRYCEKCMEELIILGPQYNNVETFSAEQLREEQHHVADMMIKYGGSFAAALGHALSYADDGNALTIKSAFPELWKQYMLFYEKLETKSPHSRKCSFPEDVEKAKEQVETTYPAGEHPLQKQERFRCEETKK